MRRFRIGTRLGLSFALLAAFVAVGSAIAIFELRQMWAEGAKVSSADAQVIAVLRVNTHVLQLQQRLKRAAVAGDRVAFQQLIQEQRSQFLEETGRAKQLLHRGANSEQERALRILETIELSIGSQLATLELLVADGDWAAVHRRLDEQLPALSVLSGDLVQEMDVMGRNAQAEAAAGIRNAITQAVSTVLITALLLVGAGLWFGRKVTRDIAGPVEQLRAAATALARGEATQIEVSESGQVELKELADAFKEMATRVRLSYDRLRESESLYRALTENSSDVVLLLDRQGVVKYASSSAQRVLGCGQPRLTGKSLFDLVDGIDRETAQEMFSRCLLKQTTERPYELRFPCVEGPPRIVELKGTHLLDDPAVRGVVFNGRDISERRFAEEALRQSETHLKQAQKMETMGRLAGGIAHDFNNVLGVIKGYTHLLDAKIPAHSPLRDYTGNIDRATQQATNLTRQLLSFTRKQTAISAVIDITAALKESEDLLQRLIGEDVELAVTVPESPFIVAMDATQFQQVIINLCVNARDAMPKGGRLAIEVRQQRVDPAAAAMLGVSATGNYACLTVTDSGAGIPDDVLPHLFEPFFTTKDPDKGTGLGLFMVYGIVRQSGGMVFAKSDRGTGSVFTIYLPEAQQAPIAQTPVERPSPVRAMHASILLVEDNEMLRTMVQSYLATRYAVKAVARPQEALDAIAESDFQLLLTDVLMPQMRGSELAVEIRKSKPGICVLFMSGYTPDGSLELTDVPNSEFIQKPFTLEELNAKIAAILSRNRPTEINAKLGKQARRVT